MVRAGKGNPLEEMVSQCLVSSLPGTVLSLQASSALGSSREFAGRGSCMGDNVTSQIL